MLGVDIVLSNISNTSTNEPTEACYQINSIMP